MKLKYVRTDKNGTKIYHDYTCDRCGGLGGSEAWRFSGWTCYKCGGTGIINKPSVYKEYTPEYRAILDARAAKRREKRMAKIEAEKPAKQAEWKAAKGFVNDVIHVVGIEDSFSVKEAIKAAGGRFNEFAGWYFSEPHEEFKTVEISAEECLYENRWGGLDWVDGWQIREIVKSKMPAEPESDYIGSVGGKVDLIVSHVRTSYYNTHFGTTWVYTFKDAEGNVLVWKTSSGIDFESEEIRLKGTIKEHSEYNGVKQTVLTRCRIA